MGDQYALTALEAAQAIREAQISSEQLVESCLARIETFEPDIDAWAHLNPDHVLGMARESDRYRRSGAAIGPLHGVPVAVKDVFDTADFPTEYGTPLYAGRKTTQDATCIALLRQAGAIIMGKTVTAEFATMTPGKTRNPHDGQRTPGGSSSGSAAAVASYMAPLALGTQTNGSVIRPASYCGVVGYKPSFGMISRHKVLRTSRSLDTIGTFGRTVQDAALLAQVMVGYDPRDPDTRDAVRADYLAMATSEPLMPPRFAFVQSPAWDQMDTSTHEAITELADVLGDRCEKVEISSVYDEVFQWLKIVMETEIAKNLASDFERGSEHMSDALNGINARGRAYHALDYSMALDRQDLFATSFDELFEEYDVILTPAALGEAPDSLDTTGNPACATLWQFAGMPSISLPLLQGPNGMPLGVQLVGQKGDDGRLLRTARWLQDHIAGLAAD